MHGSMNIKKERWKCNFMKSKPYFLVWLSVRAYPNLNVLIEFTDFGLKNMSLEGTPFSCM
jgi:hypothetical protein